MKQFLNFSNRGGQLFGAWISFIILFIVPYAYVIVEITSSDLKSGEGFYLIPVIFVLVLLALFIEFYFYKFFITGIQYKEKNVEFSGTFGEFVGIILLNVLLTVITLGIYYPWFIKNLMSFFTNNSKYEENEFKFESKGGQLLLIFVFAALIPIILISGMSLAFINLLDLQPSIVNVITYFVMVPYLYLLYKWLVNIKYKDYAIQWNTEFFSSVGYIIGQMFLTMITIGIYTPAASLRIYKYFANKTEITSELKSMKFGFENKMVNDFLFIWAQILLTIVTAFIYLPWAMAKISQRVLNQTYILKDQEIKTNN